MAPATSPTAPPPETLDINGVVLELYDPDPVNVGGKLRYTYSRPDDSRLWEYCPATGRIVQTQ